MGKINIGKPIMINKDDCITYYVIWSYFVFGISKIALKIWTNYNHRV